MQANSISLVVNRLLKPDYLAILDKRSKEALFKTMQDLLALQDELSLLPELPEVEWTRLRALEFQELLKSRLGLGDRISKLVCRRSPHFEEEVSRP